MVTWPCWSGLSERSVRTHRNVSTTGILMWDHGQQARTGSDHPADSCEVGLYGIQEAQLSLTNRAMIADKPRDAGLYSCWGMARLFVAICRQEVHVHMLQTVNWTWMNLLWQQKLCNLQQLKNRSFHVPQPTFCLSWRRPCDYHAICCMDGKTI